MYRYFFTSSSLLLKKKFFSIKFVLISYDEPNILEMLPEILLIYIYIHFLLFSGQNIIGRKKKKYVIIKLMLSKTHSIFFIM